MGHAGMGSVAFGRHREINIYTVSQVKVKTCVSKTLSFVYVCMGGRI